jgi:hypothetical protein
VFDGRGRVNLVFMALAFSSELNEETADAFGVALREGADRVMGRIGGIRPGADDDLAGDLQATPA